VAARRARTNADGAVASADDEFLTVAEMAAMLKLNQQTIRNWIDNQQLPAVHVGRRVRIRRADFDRLIQEGYSGASSSTREPKLTGEDFWDGKHGQPVAPTNPS
jgi:excisionase family DNA binding protein